MWSENEFCQKTKGHNKETVVISSSANCIECRARWGPRYDKLLCETLEMYAAK